MQESLLTANGKIKCARCTGNSSRTGEQCARPALKASKTQKCQFHGGASTGPRTEAGRERIRQAHWVHGERSAAGMAHASRMSLLTRGLADCVEVLWNVRVADLRGRPPSNYRKLTNEDDVRSFLFSHLNGQLNHHKHMMNQSI